MIECSDCGQKLECPPKMPVQVLEDENGKPFIPTDYTQIYEHMRDNHPHLWTPELAQEFEDWKAGEV